MSITEGIHDLDEATYHGDPCPQPSLSASIAKLLLARSPRHAWGAHPRLNPDHRTTESQKFDLGSAFHTLFLQSGVEVIEIDAEDYKTKAAKEARDVARAAGKIPMLKEQLARTRQMVTAVQAQVPEHEALALALAAGEAERTIAWREDNGIWCRARLDWMPETGDAYPDLKSTEASAGPDSWGRILFNMGGDIQDAFYRRGLRKLKISRDPYLLFVAAELDDPFLIATHRCAPAAAGIADRAVERAIALWGWCLERGEWPGYSRETAWHDAPPWHEQLMGDRGFAVDQLLAGAA